MSRLHPSLLVLDKGLDLQSAKLVAPEGTAFDMLNYEQVDFQGQKRIDGYVRYDGSVLSAIDDFYVSDDSDISVEEHPPYRIGFYKGKPFGIELEAGRYAVIDFTRLPPGTWGKKAEEDPDTHYNLLLEYNQFLRDKVEGLPGKVIGLHWFEDRLYAVVDVPQYSYELVAAPTIEGDAPDVVGGDPYPDYQYDITVSDGVPYTVEVIGGSLPPGFSLSETGVLSATTTDEVGSYEFTIQVKDGNGQTAQLTDTVNVMPAHWWPDRTWYKGLDAFFGGSAQTARAVDEVLQLNVVSKMARGPTGKWYAEFQGLPDSHGGSNVWPTNTESPVIGMIAANWEQPSIFSDHFAAVTDAMNVGFSTNNRVRKNGVILYTGSGATLGLGGLPGANNGSRRGMLAWDADNGNVWFGVDGVWIDSGNPATGTNPSVTGIAGEAMRLAAGLSTGRSCTLYVSSDEFAYSPPAGFAPWAGA